MPPPPPDILSVPERYTRVYLPIIVLLISSTRGSINSFKILATHQHFGYNPLLLKRNTGIKQNPSYTGSTRVTKIRAVVHKNYKYKIDIFQL